VALKGAAPLRGRRADPNGRHRYGFTPLHLAAENFSVDMVKLLFRHGASANIRTKGEDVVEGLLPLHVAVENAAQVPGGPLG
jgi:ankyrin repeat protein